MKRPLRVALNGLFLRQPMTGSGQYTLGLVRELGRARPLGEGGTAVSRRALITDRRAPPPAGWDAVSATPPIGRIARSAGGNRLTGLAENLDKVWFEQISAPTAARRLRADVLHYPYFAAPLRARPPVVVTVHDLIPLLLPAYRGGSLVQLYMRLAAAGTRAARLILADSRCTRDDVVRVLNVPPERVRVVPLAVDERFRPVEPAAARGVATRHGLGERFVFNVGGFDARKNVPRLVEAFAEARRRGYGGQLALAGRLPDAPNALFPDARALAERLGVADAVRWLGSISDGDKIALYSVCELMAYPSLYEGFGLPPLEAMACGAPVVTSNTSSLPEVVGDAAVTVDPTDVRALADAIVALADDPPRRLALAARGRTRAAGFTWARTVTQTTEAWREAAGWPEGAPCGS